MSEMAKVQRCLALIDRMANETQTRCKNELAIELVREVYPPGHPERVFYEWFNENYRRLFEACAELGVAPPPEGPRLFERLKDAVTPALIAQAQSGSEG